MGKKGAGSEPQLFSQVVDSKGKFSTLPNYNGIELRLLEGRLCDKLEVELEKFTLNGVCKWWYSSYMINKYKQGLFVRLIWRDTKLPKRCEYGYYKLLKDFSLHLKLHKSKVSKRKVIITVNYFVKNISLIVYYKTKLLVCPKGDKLFSNKLNNPLGVSHRLFFQLVDYLEGLKLLKTFTGNWCGKDNKYDNITSMFLMSDELIELCAGNKKDRPKLPEESIRQVYGDSAIIRDRETKKQREPHKGEVMKLRSLADAVHSYNKALEERVIEINGVLVPELFFRRVFTGDLDHGGRFYMTGDGNIQAKSKQVRATCTIDGEETCSLDYKHLHPSILYCKEGISLDGRDPYKCEVDLEMQYNIIHDWQEQTDMFKPYNPFRNLCKTALLCMINAKNRTDCLRAISKELRDDMFKEDSSQRKFVGLESPVPVSLIVDNLAENNKEISKYFFSDYGIVCQMLDSEMIQFCIDQFESADSVLIPIHDAITIKKSEKSFGLLTMTNAYEHVMESTLNCIIEEE